LNNGKKKQISKLALWMHLGSLCEEQITHFAPEHWQPAQANAETMEEL
jgi:hypothetical protein